MKTLLFIALIVVAVSAYKYKKPQAPPACCTPDKWEGHDMEWDPLLDYRRRDVTHYDFVSKKEKIEFTVDSRGPQRKGSILRRYDLGKEYEIIEGTCKSRATEGPMRRRCITDDFKYEVTYTLGSRLSCDLWRHVNGTRIFEVSVAATTCIPVSDLYTYYAPDETGHAFGQFWDVTPGIKDPTVFDVPPICQ